MANPRSRTTGVKILISVAAVGATLTGWAVLGSEARQAVMQAQADGQAPVPVAQQAQQAAPLPTRTAPSSSAPATSPRIVTAPPRVVQAPPMIITRSSR